jgi:hypothetical protein
MNLKIQILTITGQDYKDNNKAPSSVMRQRVKQPGEILVLRLRMMLYICSDLFQNSSNLTSLSGQFFRDS